MIFECSMPSVRIFAIISSSSFSAVTVCGAQTVTVCGAPGAPCPAPRPPAGGFCGGCWGAAETATTRLPASTGPSILRNMRAPPATGLTSWLRESRIVDRRARLHVDDRDRVERVPVRPLDGERHHDAGDRFVVAVIDRFGERTVERRARHDLTTHEQT